MYHPAKSAEIFPKMGTLKKAESHEIWNIGTPNYHYESASITNWLERISILL